MRSLIKFQLAVLAALFPAAAMVNAQVPAAQGFSVVVHSSNPVSSLSLTGLRAIFTGTVTHWPNQSKIVLAQRGSESPANQFLMARFLKTSWQDYKRSLAALEFMGQEPVIIRVLNSDPAACKFVFNVPSAVAVIESASTAALECRDVRVLRIGGFLPGDWGYRLK
jgi:PBP superfamily domain